METEKTFENEFRDATNRAEKMRHDIPSIVKAHYDAKLGRIILSLTTGAWFAFRPEDAQGIEEASSADLKDIEISPSGYGIHFPSIDADLWYPAMLEGHFGSRNWMAARLGATGGASRSKAKVTAARANGKLGGRPRKLAAK